MIWVTGFLNDSNVIKIHCFGKQEASIVFGADSDYIKSNKWNLQIPWRNRQWKLSPYNAASYAFYLRNPIAMPSFIYLFIFSSSRCERFQAEDDPHSQSDINTICGELHQIVLIKNGDIRTRLGQERFGRCNWRSGEGLGIYILLFMWTRTCKL